MIRARTSVAALALSASALISLVAVREDWRGTAYIPVEGDVPTYAFGSTKGADGKPVKLGDKIDPVRGLILLARDADEHARGLERCLGDVPLHQHEYDAYVALSYNVGYGAVCHSTIPKKLRVGQYEAACATIKDFNGMCVKRAVNGKCLEKKILRGLVNAREREYRWCMGEVQ